MQRSEKCIERNEVNKINIDGEKLQKGLAKLVLTLVEMLRQILERQAQRRVSSGTLTSIEVERLGLALMQVKQKLTQISEEFGLSREELNINLGSLACSENATLGKTSLVDVVDRLLDKGTVIAGQITISVADIDLIVLDLLAMLSAVHTQNSIGIKQSEMVKPIG